MTRNMNMKKDQNYVKSLRSLLESEVEQAEVLIAAKGFAQELQDMIEKVGRLQNEDVGPVTDQMRDTYGNQMAERFNEEMDGALQEILDNLKVTQGRINSAVNDIAEGRIPSGHSDMDSMDDELDPMGDELDPMGSELDPMGDELDDFGGDAAAAGPIDEPLGRGMKESKRDKKLRSLKIKLAEAKKIFEKVHGTG